MSFILGLFKGLWGYIAAAGAAVVAILTIYLKGKKAGQNEVIVKSQEQELKNVQTANKVEQEIATTPPADVNKRLHDKWSRD